MKVNTKRIIAIIITCLIGWAFTFLSVAVLQEYAAGLFVLLPMVMGAVATISHGYRNTATEKELRNTGFLALLFFGMGLLLFAWEGIICMVMAAPIAMVLAWIGHIVAWKIFIDKEQPGGYAAMVVMLITVPTVMAFESRLPAKEELRNVVTTVEINASPETVWKNVVEFPQLTEPTELLFKAGIAYPTNATIKGSGVGAVRHCNFSTGSFVEPITVWNEPTLLAFDVTQQPEPMKELSPYDIHPNHLHGYWVSKKGQFKLTRLPNGHTLLEGTTWYVNRIKPAFYWTLWSDYIVHSIHNRVLQHIKIESEKQS